MDNRLFEIDPYAGISYGLYQSLKGDKGSFEDFLLHYDSMGANNSDNSWLTTLVQSKNRDTLISSPQILEAMNTLGMGSLDLLTSGDFFETQVSSYKLQIMEALNQRKNADEIKPLLNELLR